MNVLDLSVFLAFGVILLLIGICKVSRTESSYLVADRKTGFFALTATLVMTEFNTATLVAFSSLGYVAGLWGLALPAVFLIGLLFYALTVARKWKAFDGLSVAAFFTERYGKGIGRFATVTLLVSMAGFSATYLKSLTLIFEPFFPTLSEGALSGILVLIPLVMTLRGGLLSIIMTDVVSFIVTCSFFPLMAFFSWKATPEMAWQGAMTAGMEKVPLWYVVSLTLLTMFTYILAPWYGQKIFAAKTKRIAYFSVIASALLVFFLYGCAVFSTATLPDSLASPDRALPHLMHHIIPSGLRGLGYGVFIAASATTLTGVWSAMTSMMVGDFFQGKLSEKAFRSMGLTFCFALVTYLLSTLFVDRILEKLILANIPVAALSFALLAGFYWKRASPGGAYCSIVVGLSCGIGSYLFFGEAGGYTWYWAIFGIPLIFLSGILGSLLPFQKKLY